jgi:hypothetical protein
MIQEKSLDRDKIFVPGCADDRQVKGNVRFDRVGNRKVGPRSSLAHFAKKFDFLVSPSNRCDARGSRIKTDPDFQKFRGIIEIGIVDASKFEICYRGSARKHTGAFSNFEKAE